ncbi:hypothetical protein HC028_01415 [Planosporangium flavigriseum]|uniref:Uncharacterized protein n=1 Tax=Planosporangium flavigriseum TaxID=373681 RepID=A0A8J3LG95_9ACTN|nr:hypothetical protein [Planosporangium flavigriseum]NJC63175.1 hypothetical protein [Planosporangium flavigriseum]GIG72447.1 hypothetical protein Pfl04_08510 [Planosporangium flavigriseum]
MDPDTTGHPFGDTLPSQRAVGTAGIPSQRPPWEPPTEPWHEQPSPFAFRPAHSAPADEEPAAGPAPWEAEPAPWEAEPAPWEAEPAADVEQVTVTAPARDAEADVDEADIEQAEAAEPAEVAWVAEPDETDEPETGSDSAPPSAGALRPGDVPETRITLWGDASAEAEAFRARIRAAGTLFVDDPNFAVTAAAAVVTDAVDALAAALQRQHADLDPRRTSDNPDTESLRVAIRRYREFLDRVLAL